MEEPRDLSRLTSNIKDNVIRAKPIPPSKSEESLSSSKSPSKQNTPAAKNQIQIQQNNAQGEPKVPSTLRYNPHFQMRRKQQQRYAPTVAASHEMNSDLVALMQNPQYASPGSKPQPNLGTPVNQRKAEIDISKLQRRKSKPNHQIEVKPNLEGVPTGDNSADARAQMTLANDTPEEAVNYINKKYSQFNLITESVLKGKKGGDESAEDMYIEGTASSIKQRALFKSIGSQSEEELPGIAHGSAEKSLQELSKSESVQSLKVPLNLQQASLGLEQEPSSHKKASVLQGGLVKQSLPLRLQQKKKKQMKLFPLKGIDVQNPRIMSFNVSSPPAKKGIHNVVSRNTVEQREEDKMLTSVEKAVATLESQRAKQVKRVPYQLHNSKSLKSLNRAVNQSSEASLCSESDDKLEPKVSHFNMPHQPTLFDLQGAHLEIKSIAQSQPSYHHQDSLPSAGLDQTGESGGRRPAPLVIASDPVLSNHETSPVLNTNKSLNNLTLVHEDSTSSLDKKDKQADFRTEVKNILEKSNLVTSLNNQISKIIKEQSKRKEIMKMQHHQFSLSPVVQSPNHQKKKEAQKFAPFYAHIFKLRQMRKKEPTLSALKQPRISRSIRMQNMGRMAQSLDLEPSNETSKGDQSTVSQNMQEVLDNFQKAVQATDPNLKLQERIQEHSKRQIQAILKFQKSEIHNTDRKKAENTPKRKKVVQPPKRIVVEESVLAKSKRKQLDRNKTSLLHQEESGINTVNSQEREDTLEEAASPFAREDLKDLDNIAQAANDGLEPIDIQNTRNDPLNNHQVKTEVTLSPLVHMERDSKKQPKRSSPSLNTGFNIKLSNQATKDHPSQNPKSAVKHSAAELSRDYQSTLQGDGHVFLIDQPKLQQQQPPQQIKKSIYLKQGAQLSANNDDPSPLISIQKLAKQTALINPRPVPTVTQQATQHPTSNVLSQRKSKLQLMHMNSEVTKAGRIAAQYLISEVVSPKDTLLASDKQYFEEKQSLHHFKIMPGGDLVLQRSPSTTPVNELSDHNYETEQFEMPDVDRGVIASNLRRSKQPRPKDPSFWQKTPKNPDSRLSKQSKQSKQIDARPKEQSRNIDLSVSVIKGQKCQQNGSFNQHIQDKAAKIKKEESKRPPVDSSMKELQLQIKKQNEKKREQQQSLKISPDLAPPGKQRRMATIQVAKGSSKNTSMPDSQRVSQAQSPLRGGNVIKGVSYHQKQNPIEVVQAQKMIGDMPLSHRPIQVRAERLQMPQVAMNQKIREELQAFQAMKLAKKQKLKEKQNMEKAIKQSQSLQNTERKTNSDIMRVKSVSPKISTMNNSPAVRQDDRGITDRAARHNLSTLIRAPNNSDLLGVSMESRKMAIEDNVAKYAPQYTPHVTTSHESEDGQQKKIVNISVHIHTNINGPVIIENQREPSVQQQSTNQKARETPDDLAGIQALYTTPQRTLQSPKMVHLSPPSIQQPSIKLKKSAQKWSPDIEEYSGDEFSNGGSPLNIILSKDPVTDKHATQIIKTGNQSPSNSGVSTPGRLVAGYGQAYGNSGKNSTMDKKMNKFLKSPVPGRPPVGSNLDHQMKGSFLLSSQLSESPLFVAAPKIHPMQRASPNSPPLTKMSQEGDVPISAQDQFQKLQNLKVQNIRIQGQKVLKPKQTALKAMNHFDINNSLAKENEADISPLPSGPTGGEEESPQGLDSPIHQQRYQDHMGGEGYTPATIAAKKKKPIRIPHVPVLSPPPPPEVKQVRFRQVLAQNPTLTPKPKELARKQRPSKQERRSKKNIKIQEFNFNNDDSLPHQILYYSQQTPQQIFSARSHLPAALIPGPPYSLAREAAKSVFHSPQNGMRKIPQMFLNSIDVLENQNRRMMSLDAIQEVPPISSEVASLDSDRMSKLHPITSGNSNFDLSQELQQKQQLYRHLNQSASIQKSDSINSLRESQQRIQQIINSHAKLRYQLGNEPTQAVYDKQDILQQIRKFNSQADSVILKSHFQNRNLKYDLGRMSRNKQLKDSSKLKLLNFEEDLQKKKTIRQNPIDNLLRQERRPLNEFQMDNSMSSGTYSTEDLHTITQSVNSTFLEMTQGTRNRPVPIRQDYLSEAVLSKAEPPSKVIESTAEDTKGTSVHRTVKTKKKKGQSKFLMNGPTQDLQTLYQENYRPTQNSQMSQVNTLRAKSKRSSTIKKTASDQEVLSLSPRKACKGTLEVKRSPPAGLSSLIVASKAEDDDIVVHKEHEELQIPSSKGKRFVLEPADSAIPQSQNPESRGLKNGPTLPLSRIIKDPPPEISFDSPLGKKAPGVQENMSVVNIGAQSGLRSPYLASMSKSNEWPGEPSSVPNELLSSFKREEQK